MSSARSGATSCEALAPSARGSRGGCARAARSRRRPGSISVTRTPIATRLLAQRLREGADAELREVVDARALAREAPGDRADVDDVARALLAHQRQRGVGAVEHAEHVRVDHPPPLLGGRVSIGPSSITPALLTSTSRRPSSACARSHERARLLLLPHVGRQRDRAAAVAATIRSASASMRSARRAASATAAPAPRAGERRRLADPRARAGHRDDLVLEIRSVMRRAYPAAPQPSPRPSPADGATPMRIRSRASPGRSDPALRRQRSFRASGGLLQRGSRRALDEPQRQVRAYLLSKRGFERRRSG